MTDAGNVRIRGALFFLFESVTRVPLEPPSLSERFLLRHLLSLSRYVSRATTPANPLEEVIAKQKGKKEH
jgi:hypothetical protein